MVNPLWYEQLPTIAKAIDRGMLLRYLLSTDSIKQHLKLHAKM